MGVQDNPRCPDCNREDGEQHEPQCPRLLAYIRPRIETLHGDASRPNRVTGYACRVCNTNFDTYSQVIAHPCPGPGADGCLKLADPRPQFDFSKMEIAPAMLCAVCQQPYNPGKYRDCPVCNFYGSEPPRAQILDAAKNHTLGDRNETHGDPIAMMELFMDLAQPIIDAPNIPKAMRGALILDAHKTARMLYNPLHIDSFEDGCAYTAIAGEASIRSKGKVPESE